GISLFPHPPSSPNVVPIECVWHDLRSGIRNWPHHPSSVSQLVEVVKAVWEVITVEDIDQHINHMGQVVDAVLAAKGGHTGY
ncbi:hypothetical protein L218DRAFT_877466, partial [Marasmius fiardii PR-910]